MPAANAAPAAAIEASLMKLRLLILNDIFAS